MEDYTQTQKTKRHKHETQKQRHKGTSLGKLNPKIVDSILQAHPQVSAAELNTFIIVKLCLI